MIECQSCLLRCLRAVSGEVVPASSASRLSLTPRHGPRTAYTWPRRRGYATESEGFASRERYAPQQESGRRQFPRRVFAKGEEFAESRVKDDTGPARSYDGHRPSQSDGKEYPRRSNSRTEFPRRRDGEEPYQSVGRNGASEHRRSFPSSYRELPRRSSSREYTPKPMSSDYTPRFQSKDDMHIAINQRRMKLEDPRETSGETDFGTTMTPELERAVKKELVYLKDPLKHANYVRSILRDNEYDKAIALCRIASKNMEVVVSWNHLIDYLLTRRELKTALKIYNEMKKRAQFPDSHTYVILLRGLAITPVHSETVGKAVSIYHSLAAPNSKVIQSIIHTNAALKVCARGHDMDSLWGIASRIADKGPNTADNYTYTTILNAIRENALLESGGRTDEDSMAQARQTAIGEGRRIWEDVIAKWRKGNLAVDEELVCAMGRLLLLGLRPRDWDDVLSLVEQTMNVPRLAPKLGTPARKAEHLYMPKSMLKDAEPNEDDEEIMGEFDKDLFKLSRKVGGGSSFAYVAPGHNTLSLVMDACLKMAAPKIAGAYWDTLTAQDGHDIVPDLDNLNMYLRLLRHSRSSTRAVEVLKNEVLDKGIQAQRKTYRIAMSACVRDKNNGNSLNNASAILSMMEKNLSELDAKTAQMFLDLSTESQDGKRITHAISRLGPVVQNLKSQLSFGSDSGSTMTEASRTEAMTLIRSVMGAIDLLLQKRLVPDGERNVWNERRSRLIGFVGRSNAVRRKRAVSSTQPEREKKSEHEEAA